MYHKSILSRNAYKSRNACKIVLNIILTSTYKSRLLKTLLSVALLSGGAFGTEKPVHTNEFRSTKPFSPPEQPSSPNTAAAQNSHTQQHRPSDSNITVQQLDFLASQQFDLAAPLSQLDQLDQLGQLGHLLAQREQVSSPNTPTATTQSQNKILTEQLKIFNGDLAFPSIVSISPDLDEKLSAKVSEGMRAVYDGNYETGLKIFNSLRETADYHPVSYVYSSVVYYLIFVDLKNYEYAARLEEELKKTIKVGKRWLRKNNSDDIWAKFYIGVAYGVRGLFHVSYDNYTKAFSDAFRGLKYMRSATEQSKDFYDSFYAIGLYDYWYATYLGLLMNKYQKRRQQTKGIADLKRAFEKGTLASSFAGLGLIEIYTYENRFEQGNEVTQYFQSNFPNFLNIYENTGKLYIKSKSPPEIIAFYKKWQESISKNPYRTSLSYLISDYNLAATYYKIGDKEQSKKILTTLFARKDIDSLVNSELNPNYVKDYYARSQELFKKLN
ncbi:hypothetical protein COTS27_00797 [Spirochaetota bacterium]|nr:hypothetical protein COTS27_00797 [Spirochaetota bacterium]